MYTTPGHHSTLRPISRQIPGTDHNHGGSGKRLIVDYSHITDLHYFNFMI